MNDFNPVAPRLTSVEKEEVRKFERAYNEYRDSVIQYNQSSLRNQRISMRKRSQCVDRALLEVLMIQELATKMNKASQYHSKERRWRMHWSIS